jgi:hypothetical protein
MLDTYGHLIKVADGAAAEATAFGELMIKYFSVAVMVLIAIYALGPAHWALRTGLGWQTEHVLGYFAVTLLLCLAWPRPLVVGVAVMIFAPMLEGLQGLTPDRHPNLLAALCGASGALAAALLAELFIRVKAKWEKRNAAAIRSGCRDRFAALGTKEKCK